MTLNNGGQLMEKSFSIIKDGMLWITGTTNMDICCSYIACFYWHICLSNYSSGKEEFCYRCFRMKILSYSILQLHTKTLNRCFTREEMAIASCPSGIHIHSKHSKELILFRKILVNLIHNLFPIIILCWVELLWIYNI